MGSGIVGLEAGRGFGVAGPDSDFGIEEGLETVRHLVVSSRVGCEGVQESAADAEPEPALDRERSVRELGVVCFAEAVKKTALPLRFCLQLAYEDSVEDECAPSAFYDVPAARLASAIGLGSGSAIVSGILLVRRM
jgi:hypothetical protein